MASTSPAQAYDGATTATSWFNLVPDTTYVDGSQLINQTGLSFYTESTEIDDGGFVQVTFGDNPDEASPFYIDAGSGKLMGQQSYWGLEAAYTWKSDFQGSLWSWSADGTPDVTSYSYPTFKVDAAGKLQTSGEALIWGWCPDRDGVGDGDVYLPGIVFLTNDTTKVQGLGCTTFDGLKIAWTDPPEEVQ